MDLSWRPPSYVLQLLSNKHCEAEFEEFQAQLNTSIPIYQKVPTADAVHLPYHSGLHCSFFFFFLLLLLFFWLHSVACRIIVPQPGIEPASPAVEAWSLNHWTTREIPVVSFSKFQAFQTRQLNK